MPFDSAALFTNRERANRAIATALLSIRDKLKAAAGLHCPTLKAALLRYLMMTRPGISVKELRAQFFTTGSEVLDDIIQALNQAGELGAEPRTSCPVSVCCRNTARGSSCRRASGCAVSRLSRRCPTNCAQNFTTGCP